MGKKLIIICVIIGFMITFFSAVFFLYPTVEESKNVLNRTLKKYDEVPEEGYYYTMNHETKKILKWRKP